MRFLALILILLAASLAGCSSQDTNITLRPEIRCDDIAASAIVTPDNTKQFSGGPIIYFEILVDAIVESDKDQTNTPDISPSLSIPLP